MELVKKLTALFIDDDCDDVEFLTASLMKTKRFDNIYCFENGPDALAFMENSAHVPNVIIMDLKLPLMTGLELLAAIRKNPQLAHVPVLIFSGSIYPQDIEKTQQSGATGYIVKPGRADHFDEVAMLIATTAEKNHPWAFDNYVQKFGLN